MEMKGPFSHLAQIGSPSFLCTCCVVCCWHRVQSGPPVAGTSSLQTHCLGDSQSLHNLALTPLFQCWRRQPTQLQGLRQTLYRKLMVNSVYGVPEDDNAIYITQWIKLPRTRNELSLFVTVLSIRETKDSLHHYAKSKVYFFNAMAQLPNNFCTCFHVRYLEVSRT